MIIKNFEDLATSVGKSSNYARRIDCLNILEAGLQAADPDRIIRGAVTTNGITRGAGNAPLRTSKYSGIFSVAFGKAADTMTRALNSVLPMNGGIIVMPKRYRSAIRGRKFQVFNAGHPVPDQASVKAARDTIKFLHNRRKDQLVVFLVSGGGSALLAMPDGITLDDKIRVTDLLLRSGIPIGEFNCVRKHISKIKGGKLVDTIGCDWICLIMSDVQGDDPSEIASGTTCADTTTFVDALQIIEKYELAAKMPAQVMDVLYDGVSREGRGDAAAGNFTTTHAAEDNIVIANNDDCLEAMRRTAKDAGYDVTVIKAYGEIKDVTRQIINEIESSVDGQHTNTGSGETQYSSKNGGAGDINNTTNQDDNDVLCSQKCRCIIFGGETTVKVLSRKGVGGRNQELVLRILKNMRGAEKRMGLEKRKTATVIASMGTDGIDGSSAFAGAMAEPSRADDIGAIKEALRTSDSGRFFARRGGGILTGPTHTNLQDIGVIIV